MKPGGTHWAKGVRGVGGVGGLGGWGGWGSWGWGGSKKSPGEYAQHFGSGLDNFLQNVQMVSGKVGPEGVQRKQYDVSCRVFRIPQF